MDYQEENGFLGANNLNQHTYISNLGNLYLVISEKNTIEDYWDICEINDEKFMRFKFSMHDITK